MLCISCIHWSSRLACVFTDGCHTMPPTRSDRLHLFPHTVPDNPTSTLVRRLQKEASSLKAQRVNVLETHIMETSADAVRKEVCEMYTRVCSKGNASVVEAAAATSSSSTAAEGGITIVFLHLGVNYRGTQFQLEQCGYNDATFRIPDERGYQPTGECIIAGNKFGKCFTASLDLQTICKKLQNDNDDENNPSVTISTNPGRFVCNYTYCLSLNQSQTVSKEGNTTKTASLFVHVPPFEVASEDVQFEFVIRIMKAIEGHLCSQ